MATQQSRQQAQGRGKNGITIWMALASEGEQRKQQIQHATRRVLGTHHLDDRDGLRARACRPRPLSRRRDARASELSGRGVSQQRMPASHDLRPFEERATHTRRIEARLELRDAQGAPEEHKRTELPAQRRCGRTRRRGRADGGASLRRLFGDPCGVPEAVGPRRTRAIDAQERLVTSGAPETKQGAAPARECEKVPCAAAHHQVTLENDGGGFEADVAAECGRALARCRAGEARKQLRAGVGTALRLGHEQLRAREASTRARQLELHARTDGVGHTEDGDRLRVERVQPQPARDGERALAREQHEPVGRQVESRGAHHADAHVPVRRQIRPSTRTEHVAHELE